jgi:hypothetical protein
MGLSNPDRASATSIYTHVARLFIPSFYPSLSPRIACPVSSCMSCQLRIACPVSSALHVLSASSSAPHCMSCQLSISPRIACPFLSSALSCQLAHRALHVLSALSASRIACPVSSVLSARSTLTTWCMSSQPPRIPERQIGA